MSAETAVREPADYPRELEGAVTLRDGARVRIRPIRPDDAPRLCALYDRLSADTAYQRFFTVMRRLPPDWARVFATVDYRRRLALVAEHDAGGEPELIGVGRYEFSEKTDLPEVAFVVQDGWQGKGLGTVLLQELLRAGAARGITRFRAYVLADNVRMLDLLARLTDVLDSRTEDGVKAIVFAPRDAARAGAP
jgi:RimJ/RimL family protein N-acetyltransferase